MTSIELYKAYAEINQYNSWKEVWKEHEAGRITNRELFDSWLEYEGIIHYTDRIIEAYRKCFQ